MSMTRPGSRGLERWRRAFVAAVAAGATLGVASKAHADEPNDYCKKVTARAESDAAVLFAPTVSAQVIKFPESGAVDSTGTQVGQGVQPRAAVTIGFVDIYKGVGVLDVAKQDCRRQASTVSLEEIVLQRADIGRRTALERQLAFFDAKRPVVEALMHDAEQRFAAHVATVLEIEELRRTMLEIDMKRSSTERDLAVLTRQSFVMPTQPISEMLDAYDAQSVAYEKSLSHVRNLTPWKLNATGGVTAAPTVDVYGVVELSYNFGGLFSVPAESRAIDARASEVKNARYEMRHQIETLLDELRISAQRTRVQVARLDEELAHLDAQKKSLDGLDAPNKAQVIAALTLESIDIEADRTYLAALADEQGRFGGTK